MPSLTVPSNLPTLVKDAFAKAQATGDLIYYPTQVAVVTVGSFAVGFYPHIAMPKITRHCGLTAR